MKNMWVICGLFVNDCAKSVSRREKDKKKGAKLSSNSLISLWCEDWTRIVLQLSVFIVLNFNLTDRHH